MKKINKIIIIMAVFAICCFLPSILANGHANYIQLLCIAIDMFLIGRYSVIK